MTTWYRPVALNPSAKIRLFVFHHAGGSANAYFRWAQSAPNDWEAILYEMPGRGMRMDDPVIDNFSQMLDVLSSETPKWLDRPTIFFGHSLGALVAYELARKLIQDGLGDQLRGLGLSSMLPPTQENLNKREFISQQPEAEFIKSISAYSPMPEQILRDPKFLAFFLPIVRNDIRLMESYSTNHQEKVNLPLLVFAGAQDPTSTPQQLADWNEFGNVIDEVQTLPGGHFHLFAHAEKILASLRTHLA
jgi:medium-chain acyl-[acyl-carrier-protein] hydrolase